MNKTKMVGTIGPSSVSYDVIKSMIISGVDVIRINMAYASFDFAKEVILSVRKIDLELGKTTGIMIDTVGPELKIGGLEKPEVYLEKGRTIRLVDSEIIGNSEIVSVNKEIITHTKINDEIYLNNASVKLKVITKDEDNLLCEIKNNGVIISESTINVPNVDFNIKFLNERDISIVKFALEMKVDYLALSKVKEELDILDVNDLLISLNDSNITILSKIENAHAYEQIDKILNVSDGIIISRGDLAIDMGIEKVPSVQKELTMKAKTTEKIVVIATEMFTSMKDNEKPTRAEVSDVANAVIDSVDALMLGAETAIGSYPIETVKIMNSVIEEIEKTINYNELLKNIIENEEDNISKAIAYSSVDVGNKVHAKAIVCSTLSGKTAKDISFYRPSSPVIAISPNSDVVRGLSINYGIIPLTVGMAKTTDELIELSIEASKKALDLKMNDKVVIVGSFPLESINYTNFMKIEEIK